MKFVFTDKKVTLPGYVHAYAEKKVGKLDRYFKTEGEASITFSVEKDRNRAEVTVRSGSMILRASESSSDMRASIDACVSMIERQIRKNKSRLEKRLRTDAFERTVDPSEISDFVPEEEEPEFKVVRTKRFPIKDMTVDEAILQMNLVGHTFFAFKNADMHGAFSVVYKRNDGGYGIIEDDT
ncbi:MAG TPA: ribosome-associated translation inhibitor RaiA [Candidatus Intestinimonas stercoravium]|uniref:ribosome hibernation-promoting factor, HPF/YfiA family n=1 Tax=uncultured Intestinimonas sp. TaxID=1689265 RepID=UPI001F86669F|nr:ribosome-associated translation inhibitor RaiA [uncultured Intestinimonas sp.]HJA63251.1 ribosome-associated translation inhibitor RaiA [Candidatus Intestinimonas stercoravium]